MAHRAQALPLALSLIASLVFIVMGTAAYSNTSLVLEYIITLGFGFLFSKGRYGFTSSFRSLITARDPGPFVSQMIMIVLTALFFAMVRSATGERGEGTFSPFSVIGSFIFGLGMQLSGGCASGHLVQAGTFSVTSWIAIIFFCIGSVIGIIIVPELDEAAAPATDFNFSARTGPWFSTLILLGICGAISLITLGWGTTVSHDFVISCKRVWTYLIKVPEPDDITPPSDQTKGERIKWFWSRCLFMKSWPPIVTVVGTAALNACLLGVVGSSWGCSGPMYIIPCRVMLMCGADMLALPYLAGSSSITKPLLSNIGVQGDLGVIIGSSFGSGLSRTSYLNTQFKTLPAIYVFGAMVGGTLLGIGARIAGGCNVGGYYSALSDGSVSGLIWLFGALVGTFVGVLFRRLLGMPNESKASWLPGEV